jgi:hypothetical protein
MCGIVGYVSTGDRTYEKTKADFLRDALILDTFRGMDSTGVISVAGEDFNVRTRRAVKKGWEFVNTKQYKQLPVGWAAVGHNRAATKGGVTIDNAHPFTVGPIALVHNGTLNDMGRSLPGFCSKQDVDSMNICRSLAEVPPGEAAEEVLRHISGAYALVWTDKRDKSINIARNGQRPMHFAHTTGKSVLWFMSDGMHLDMMKKHQWCYASDMGQIFQLATHKHFKWHHGEIKPEIKAYSPFVPRSSAASSQQPTKQPSASSTESDNWGAKQTKRSKRAPLSHRIYLNGKIDVIPPAMTSDLALTTDLTPDDRLRFVPEGWTAYPRHGGVAATHGYAIGTVYLPEWECHWECVVHNIRADDAEKICKDAWTVIPYATTADTMHKDPNFAVMARISAFADPEPSQSVTIDEEEEESATQLSFPGPFGRLYSGPDWASLVRHGCCMCSVDIDFDDADELEWVGEMQSQPLCPECAEYYLKEF